MGERHETALPQITNNVAELEQRVNMHMPPNIIGQPERATLLKGVGY